MIKTFPRIALLDEEGYPTEEWLQFLRTYEPNENIGIMDFLDILYDSWAYNTWGYKLSRKYRGKRKLALHTGGWSGNESIIDAILSNVYLTHFEMRYVKWITGGHYYFEILQPKKPKK